MIKPRKLSWPTGLPEGDTVLGRHRHMIREIIQVALSGTPKDLGDLVAKYISRGETWLLETPAPVKDRRLSRNEAAELLGVQPGTIRKLVQREKLKHYVDGYSEAEVLAYRDRAALDSEAA